MVSAAATARSPQRIRKRQPASRVVDRPWAVIRSSTCTGSGSSGVVGPCAARREGVRASRTAVGEPRAVRTERRAGAGAGGTCSGMWVASLVRQARRREEGGGAGADGAVCSRKDGRGEARVGEQGCGSACRPSRDGLNTAGTRTEGVTLLPCGRSLYDACSADVSSIRFREVTQAGNKPQICGTPPDFPAGCRR